MQHMWGTLSDLELKTLKDKRIQDICVFQSPGGFESVHSKTAVF